VLYTDTPDLAEQNERHKQDQLQKQKEGKGHWKPELASNSEEAVSSWPWTRFREDILLMEFIAVGRRGSSRWRSLDRGIAKEDREACRGEAQVGSLSTYPKSLLGPELQANTISATRHGTSQVPGL